MVFASRRKRIRKRKLWGGVLRGAKMWRRDRGGEVIRAWEMLGLGHSVGRGVGKGAENQRSKEYRVRKNIACSWVL